MNYFHALKVSQTLRDKEGKINGFGEITNLWQDKKQGYFYL